MKLLSVLLLVLMPVAAYGRIGDTLEELDKRYGKAVIANNSKKPGVIQRCYNVKGFNVAADVNKTTGLCEQMIYSRVDKKWIHPVNVEGILRVHKNVQWKEILPGARWSVTENDYKYEVIL